MAARAQATDKFNAFRERVLADPALLERLRSARDVPEFVSVARDVARDLGFELRTGQIEAALRDARREWIERWAQ